MYEMHHNFIYNIFKKINYVGNKRMGKLHVVVEMISDISKRKAKKIKILLLGSSNQ